MLVACAGAGPLRPGVDPDTAIASAFRRQDTALRFSATLLRYSVSDELEAVVALGSPSRLGLFLQNKSRLDLVYVLKIAPHRTESLVRVERAEPGFVVLSLRGEKSARFANLKLVFDARSKRLLREVEYQPFGAGRVVARQGVPHLVTTDGRTDLLLAPSGGSFRIVSQGPAVPQDGPYLAAPPANLPPLRQSSYEVFAGVRPERVRDGYRREGTEIREEIGPWQRFEGRIWFGKTFYDGEGTSGVGGFGYFDLATRRYTIYAPPKIVDWSVSAVLVTGEAVWLGLCRRGEWGGGSGSLLRWDRATHDVRRYSLGSTVGRMVLHEGRVYLGTGEGVGVVGEEGVEEFFVDVTTSRGYEIAARRALRQE